MVSRSAECRPTFRKPTLAITYCRPQAPSPTMFILPLGVPRGPFIGFPLGEVPCWEGACAAGSISLWFN